MGNRDKAISELKRRIQEQRDRMDPKLLEMAQRAALAKQQGVKRENFVPYDREQAAAAVELFLRRHGNRADFEKRLRELLRDN